MQWFSTQIGSDEEQFYGSSLALLENAITNLLFRMDMVCKQNAGQGQRNPIASYTTRIKTASSMKRKLALQHLPITLDSALHKVYDAAGVRIICPLIDDIYTVVKMIHAIPDVTACREKDYIRHPKPNGYRSYHITVSLPARITGNERVWIEIQLRTIAMDCWASIEHQLKYKHDIPNQRLIVSELKRCADEIASTDLSLQTIYDLINTYDPNTKPA